MGGEFVCFFWLFFCCFLVVFFFSYIFGCSHFFFVFFFFFYLKTSKTGEVTIGSFSPQQQLVCVINNLKENIFEK